MSPTTTTCSTRRRARRTLLPLASVSLLALAACGGDGSASPDRVASLGESTTTAATSDTGAEGANGKKGDKDDMQQAALDFAKCMREHGIDFPDPQFTGDGGMVFSAGAEPGSGPDRDEMEAAQKACQPIMDRAQANLPPPDPKELEEQKEQILAFAKCMREHGIDFPDPTFDGKGGVQIQIDGEGSGMDPNSPAMKKANEECSKATGMPLPQVQTGPGAGPSDGPSTKSGSSSDGPPSQAGS
jgi:hypothetical protein